MASEIQPQQRCKLLALPPEMRNQIYRAVLLERDKITLDLRFRLPKLLRVCRKIRSEARGIYFEENKFIVHITDHDAIAYLRFERTINHARDIPAENLIFRLSSSDNWDNLMRWMHAFYLDECSGPGRVMEGRAFHETDAIAELFTELSRLSESKVAWREVEVVMRHAMEAVAVTRRAMRG